jgi:hypothetical protein
MQLILRCGSYRGERTAQGVKGWRGQGGHLHGHEDTAVEVREAGETGDLKLAVESILVPTNSENTVREPR